MIAGRIGTLALATVLLGGSASVALAASDQHWCVAVLEQSAGAKPEALASVRRGVRKGIRSAGGRLLSEATSRDVEGLVGPDCDERCLEAVRRKVAPDRLMVVRVATAGARFTIHAASGEMTLSAIGPESELEQAAVRIGHSFASSRTVLLLEGVSPSVNVFIDRKRVRLSANGTVEVKPGAHVVRIGRYVVRRVVAVPGEVTTVTFESGTSGDLVRLDPLPTHAPAKTAGVGRAPPSTSVNVAAMVLAGRRSRAVSWTGGRYATGFGGGGARVEGGLVRGLWMAAAEVELLSFEGSTARVVMRDGSTRTVTGGIAYRAAGMTGIRWGSGQRDSAAAVAVGLGGSLERQSAKDISGSFGEAGLFPSYERLAAELAVEGAVPLVALVPVGGLHAFARLDVSPWSTWRERPSGSTGESVRTGVDPGWRLGLGWAQGRLGVRAQYEGAMRSLAFEGDGVVPVNPPLRDATVRMMDHRVGIAFTAGL